MNNKFWQIFKLKENQFDFEKIDDGNVSYSNIFTLETNNLQAE